jgi:hypothetical protein
MDVYVPERAHASRRVPACTSTVNDTNAHDSIVDARDCAAQDGLRDQDSFVDARVWVSDDVRIVHVSIVGAHDHAPVGDVHASIVDTRGCAPVSTSIEQGIDANASIGRGALPAKNKV